MTAKTFSAYQTFRLAIFICCIAVACESDAKKYQRLETDYFIAKSRMDAVESRAARGEPQCPELTSLPTNAYLKACTDSISEWRTDLALKEREINRFMHP